MVNRGGPTRGARGATPAETGTGLTYRQASGRQNMPMPKPPTTRPAATRTSRGRRGTGSPGQHVSIDGLSLEAGLSGAEPAAMPTLATLGSIETMRATVAMARALVEGGRDVDLAGLEHDAAAICQALDHLPAHSARAMRPAMLALMREVEALAVVIPAR